MNLNEYLNIEEYFTDLPDCIFCGDDYKELIEKSLLLTKSQLVLESFSSNVEGEKYNIEVIVNSKVIKGIITITNDYVNESEFLHLLNEIKNINESLNDFSYYSMCESYCDFGIAFVLRNKYDDLKSKGMLNKYIPILEKDKIKKRPLEDLIRITNEIESTSDPIKKRKLLDEVKEFWNIDLEN